ncbi:MAG: S1C family serine protease [Bryobacteraceae bacterium]|nr:S1C family serine protease [Bryobacteraceae bacterium]
MVNDLAAWSNQLAAAVEVAGQHVAALQNANNTFAAGILWPQDGGAVVVTADHALHQQEVRAVVLPDGREVAASVAGRDPGTDIAVLRLAESVSAPALPAAATDWKAGHLALAVGRSSDAGLSASLGIISVAAGPWRTWRGGQVDQMLRLDLGLYPGASGGIVVGGAQTLIGMATRGLSRVGSIALPFVTLSRVVAALVSGGRVVRGYLGVGLQPIALPPHLSQQKYAHAHILVSVEPQGPAEQAGLMIGDIVLAIEGKAIEDTGGLIEFLDSGSVGKTLSLDILRGGHPETVGITVGPRPGKD